MSEKNPEQISQMDDETLSEIGRKAERKMRYRREESSALWFGLGTMGIVGWSVAIPMLLGIALGMYLDEHAPVSFSWVLTGLIGGLILGCLNAWFWIRRNQQEIQKQREDS